MTVDDGPGQIVLCKCGGLVRALPVQSGRWLLFDRAPVNGPDGEGRCSVVINGIALSTVYGDGTEGRLVWHSHYWSCKTRENEMAQ